MFRQSEIAVLQYSGPSLKSSVFCILSEVKVLLVSYYVLLCVCVCACMFFFLKIKITNTATNQTIDFLLQVK